MPDTVADYGTLLAVLQAPAPTTARVWNDHHPAWHQPEPGSDWRELIEPPADEAMPLLGPPAMLHFFRHARLDPRALAICALTACQLLLRYWSAFVEAHPEPFDAAAAEAAERGWEPPMLDSAPWRAVAAGLRTAAWHTPAAGGFRSSIDTDRALHMVADVAPPEAIAAAEAASLAGSLAGGRGAAPRRFDGVVERIARALAAAGDDPTVFIEHWWRRCRCRLAWDQRRDTAPAATRR